MSELVEPLVRWLASPGGNLLWDLFLQGLGIFITVVVLQRYLERREERRWLPARQHLYQQLFEDADWLVGLLREYRERPLVWYRFGYIGYGSKELDESFAKTLYALHVSALYDRVRTFADQPDVLDDFKQQLDTQLEHSAAVFLAREPELNRLIGQLREQISHFEGSLEVYREARETGRDPAARLGSSAINQAGIALRELIFAAYQLRSWLADHADRVEPHPADPDLNTKEDS